MIAEFKQDDFLINCISLEVSGIKRSEIIKKDLEKDGFLVKRGSDEACSSQYTYLCKGGGLNLEIISDTYYYYDIDDSLNCKENGGIWSEALKKTN